MLGILLVTLLAVSGCKIVTDMPAGGVLESSTGVYGCSEGELCTFVVDHVYFSDSFTAVPSEGYEFSHWSDEPGSFCAGKQSPTCSQINSTYYQSLPEWIEWLVADTTYTLKPVFVETITPPEQPESIWTYSSTHQAENYLVEGDTAEEIIDSVLGPANPLDYSPVTGDRAVGLAAASYSFSYAYTVDGDDCQIVSGEMEVTYTTTLPQLSDAASKDPELKQQWDAYLAAVVEHEAGHQRINRMQYPNLPALLDDAADVPCDDLPSALNAISDAFSLNLYQLQDDYHQEVGYSILFNDYF